MPSILLFDADPQRCAALTDRLRREGCQAHRLPLRVDASPVHTGEHDAAVVVATPSGDGGDSALLSLLRRLTNEHVATLVWAPQRPAANASPLIEWLSPEASLEEVAAKAGTLARYGPLLRLLERELQHFQRLGEQLNEYFNQIDQEMRLAGRLQRDFLPRCLPEVSPYRFQVVYRPASWVSGDIYDVFLLDERHVGMYVADAMGHGVAAGLMTMFLRQALVPKRKTDEGEIIVPPGEALAGVNECLVRQKLPNTQFVTAVYGVLDTQDRTLRLARAGHPYALHIRADGTIRELRSDGGLLGLADVAVQCAELRLPLSEGDKLLLYTDGLEDALLESRGEQDEPRFTARLLEWAKLPGKDLAAAVERYLDEREGSLHPADDVTLVILEAAAASRAS